jgi:hypothetical protein
MEGHPDPDPEGQGRDRAGRVLPVAVVLAVALVLGVTFLRGLRQSHDVSYSVGLSAASLLPPLLSVAVFSASKRFRNPRSQLAVVLWASVVLLGVLLSPVWKVLTASR